MEMAAVLALLDNHMHGVLKLNDDVAAEWSDEEVVSGRGKLFSPRGKDRDLLEVSEAWVEVQRQNVRWVAVTRRRLNSWGWLMKCLKGPMAR